LTTSSFRLGILWLASCVIALGQGSQLPKYTVATLPSASTQPTYTVQVIDGISASDCTVGGGYFNVICVVNGGIWQSAGVGGIPGWTITGSGSSQVAAAPGTISAGASVQAPLVGPRYVVSNFSGADTLTRINACNATVIAAGGGICDATTDSTTATYTSTIYVGCSMDGTHGPTCPLNSSSVQYYPHVELILPVAGRWAFNITDGVSCGLYQNNNTDILSDSTNSASNPTILTDVNSSTYMRALYCTDNSVSGSYGYYHAKGFSTQVYYGTMTGAVVDVRGRVYDQSQFEGIGVYLSSGNTNLNRAIWIEQPCCQATFDRLNVVSSGMGIPLTIGQGSFATGISTTSGSPTISYTAVSLNPTALVGQYVYTERGDPLTNVGIFGYTILAVNTSAKTMTLSGNATASSASPGVIEIQPSGVAGPRSIEVKNSTFNFPENGMPNVFVTGNYSTSGVYLHDLYMERDGNSDTTTADIILGQNVQNVTIDNPYQASKGYGNDPPILTNYTTMQTWNITGAATITGIVDAANGVTISPYVRGASSGSSWGGVVSYNPSQSGVTTTSLSIKQVATPPAPYGLASTSGGSLAAGTYTVSVSALDAVGEISACAAGSGQTAAGATAAFTTTGSSGSVALWWTSPSGAAGYNVWLSSGQCFNTVAPYFVLTTGTGTTGTIPVTNTSGSFQLAGPFAIATLAGGSSPTSSITIEPSSNGATSGNTGKTTLLDPNGNSILQIIAGGMNIGSSTAGNSVNTNEYQGPHGTLGAYSVTYDDYHNHYITNNDTGSIILQSPQTSIKLGDAAGADFFTVQNSTPANMFEVNSTGKMSTAGDIYFEGLLYGTNYFRLTGTPSGQVSLTMPATSGTLALTVGTGTLALPTTSITNGTCTTATTTTGATGVLATDTVEMSSSGSIHAVTGYGSGGVSVYPPYSGTGSINVDVCNWTASPITPGAVTMNWRVSR